MYRPAAFDISEQSAMHDFIDGCGPAQLVTSNGGRLTASIVPLLLDRSVGEHGTLVGHLARPNPQWRNLDGSVEALAIFTGADAYVSPTYYPTKAETGKVVPTWNYVTVHAHGPLLIHDDKQFVERVVRGLTQKHEGRRPEPWSVDDAPAQYIDAMLGGIVGFELSITLLEGKAKLSQNKSRADIDGTIAGLADGTPAEREVAAMMRDIG